MTNSADPDQLASSEANWSGSTLFAKTACRVLQEKGYVCCICLFHYLGFVLSRKKNVDWLTVLYFIIGKYMELKS